ncbi:MAG: glycosyltransferase family 2 protein [Phycisphaerales bacterium]|nr:glycosyltransferase family 2 protein [Phycisphaerales bacterium]
MSGESASNMSGVYVVIAAYNEEAVIADVLSDLGRIAPNTVVVDDGSSDGTYEAACGVSRWTLRHSVNRGQGASLQTGIEFALRQGAEYIVTFDADGQHRPEDIPRLIEPLRSGEYDIALGSRFLGSAINLPSSRRLMLRLAVLFTRMVSGLRITDAHNGLRAMTRRAASQVDLRLDRMAHASELLDIIGRMKLPYCEIPVEIRYTDYSKQKGQRLSNAPRILFHYLLGRAMR